MTALRAIARVVPALALCLLVAGCGILASRQRREPRYAVSLHQVAPTPLAPGSEQTLVLGSLDGTRVTVFRWPIVSATVIRAAAVAVGPGGRRDLRLDLDPAGRLQWIQACAQSPGAPVVVVVDGLCARTFPMPRPAVAAEDRVVVPGPWDPVQLEQIVRNASLNYEKLHP